MRLSVEIAVQDVRGARTAIDAGATRIELCQALVTGGLTPSLGLMEHAIDAIGADRVHVLIRPRPGGFVYDEDEVRTMERDVRAVSRLGAGVVIGALTPDRTIDVAVLARLVGAADGHHVTLHRAIDVVPDAVAAAAALGDLGISRILTSGGAARAIDGAEGLAALAEATRDAGIEVMAGGGVVASDVAVLLETGVSAVHASCRMLQDDTPSGPGGGVPQRELTDAAQVADVVAAARHP